MRSLKEILRSATTPIMAMPTRAELADQYLAQLPYAPYPVQEEALLAWFTAKQGVLVCAPTGTGKTLIAEAALMRKESRGGHFRRDFPKEKRKWRGKHIEW